ncbi:hypothetical protein GUITHDRAFT_113139 [Guillardia theta CCMP2712]|uniref:DDT domain-containing protein n=1 Tax=Guillardia theta (strain CCMP2712) TaxID=905079 RepID=L1IYB4_GUITC|nr:hypothetical protein GUITHDRAFT_113139 [Guillardia theta CCMP2712]EKX40879.1 hypothetical protein GUITHDRAFT_113139 [Guillardia theta CCMP2712]|eukprot:XP_005827859.1 hypothetical protein GUITHDRAFT_113139 [Guillardia theta CCMP2712]
MEVEEVPAAPIEIKSDVDNKSKATNSLPKKRGSSAAAVNQKNKITAFFVKAAAASTEVKDSNQDNSTERGKKEKGSEECSGTIQESTDCIVLSDHDGEKEIVAHDTPPTSKKCKPNEERLNQKPLDTNGEKSDEAKNDAVRKQKKSSTDHKKISEENSNRKAETGSRQSILDFGKSDGKTVWKKKCRPEHPCGDEVSLNQQAMLILQFCNTFSEVLGITETMAEELNQGPFTVKRFPSPVLSKLHVAFLRAIVRGGETPDEERMIDEDTWPEVLRQHLKDSNVPEHQKLVEKLSNFEYSELSLTERFEALEFLVEDCISSPVIGKYIDSSLDRLEELRKEQQMEEILEKYKKPEIEVCDKLDCFVESETTTSPQEDLQNLTDRQRAVVKAREDEARAHKIAEEKRLREEKRIAEEESKRKEEIGRKERAESRSREICFHTSIVRVPCLSSGQQRYWVGKCIKQRANLLWENMQGTDPKQSCWKMIQPGEPMDQLYEHWSPTYPENEIGFQKKLRDMVHTYSLCEADVPGNHQGDEKEEQEDAAGDEDKSIFQRAQDVLLNIEESTPEDMLQNFLKATKMREGWDTVQKVWIKDVEEATTVCSLLYLMKQLRVYIGRQKSRPGKLASIFSAVPLRITRSQGTRATKSESVELSGESSEEAEDMEENSDGDVQPKAVQKRARQSRPAAPLRRSTRTVNKVKRYEQESSDSDSDFCDSETKRVTRRTAKLHEKQETTRTTRQRLYTPKAF